MSDTNTMSDEAKKARNEYLKEWRKKNPNKVKQYAINRWEKVARANDHYGENRNDE